jgi:hypothetical protein
VGDSGAVLDSGDVPGCETAGGIAGASIFSWPIYLLHMALWSNPKNTAKNLNAFWLVPIQVAAAGQQPKNETNLEILESFFNTRNLVSRSGLEAKPKEK